MGSTDKLALADTLMEALESGITAETLADGFAKALNKAQEALQKKKEDAAASKKEVEALAHEASDAITLFFEAYAKHKGISPDGGKVSAQDLMDCADVILELKNFKLFG